MHDTLNLVLKNENPTVVFSGMELKKYLEKLSAQEMVQVDLGCNLNQSQKCIELGLYSDFGLPNPISDQNLFDDAYHIEIKNSSGFIMGLNPRSILLGVYRFLYECGIRWIRPSEDGEIIPPADILALAASIDETPSYRHRGICIEGAVSFENVRDMIDWAPKMGFNSYFIQFREAYAFFDRWYNHHINHKKAPEGFSIEKAKEIVKALEEEISKRGMAYHAVGHGWTCEPFGIPGLSWEKNDIQAAREVQQYLAQVNGKREIWGGIPLNTNLCYSNPEVRKIVVNSIIEYLEEHKNIDALHFWLADGYNNQCECENCIKEIPPDLYVQMLNELDELMTQRKMNTKIVFLIYCELMWAPQVRKINNSDRFILMFAPITRTYSKSFSTDILPEITPPYIRNKVTFPSSIGGNIAFLKEWQKTFSGDSFDFDYHFMWDHYCDPGQFAISRIISEDIKNLKEVGLNGFMSCQVQRSFFPNGLGMYMMGRTLWNSSFDFDKEAVEYFEKAYGADGHKAMAYLEKLTGLFDPPYLRGEREMVDMETSQRYASIEAYVKTFTPVIMDNLKLSNKSQAQSWHYLKLHQDFCIHYASMLEQRSLGNREGTHEKWNAIKEFLCDHEDDIQRVFDLYEFVQTFEVMTDRILGQ